MRFGVRVQGLGFRVWGLGSRVSDKVVKVGGFLVIRETEAPQASLFDASLVVELKTFNSPLPLWIVYVIAPHPYDPQNTNRPEVPIAKPGFPKHFVTPGHESEPTPGRAA